MFVRVEKRIVIEEEEEKRREPGIRLTASCANPLDNQGDRQHLQDVPDASSITIIIADSVEAMRTNSMRL